jgi:hypothetical protein
MKSFQGRVIMYLCCHVLKKISQQLPAFICSDSEGIDRTAIHEDMDAKIHKFFKEA